VAQKAGLERLFRRAVVEVDGAKHVEVELAQRRVTVEPRTKPPCVLLELA
jgi:hypothetical protein